MKLSFFAVSIAVAAAFNFAEGQGDGIRGGVNSATLGGCYSNSDCASGRCEGRGFSGGTCKAKEGGGAACDENSDCLSDKCTGSFGCSANNSCTCEPPPTQEPTAKPTQTPTQKPTQKPTLKPTHMPTQTPTSKPTFKPTPLACSSSEDCYKLGGAYRCEGSTLFKDGECEAKEDVGAACNEDEDCLSDVCKGSFGCSVNKSCTCRPSESKEEYNADFGEGEEDHASSRDGHTTVA